MLTQVYAFLHVLDKDFDGEIDAMELEQRIIAFRKTAREDDYTDSAVITVNDRIREPPSYPHLMFPKDKTSDRKCRLRKKNKVVLQMDHKVRPKYF